MHKQTSSYKDLLSLFNTNLQERKKNLYIPLEKICYAPKQWCICVTLDLKYI